MNIYGVIMAGGGGTRFWPLSRQKTPKQLLNLSGKDLMINDTIDRLVPIIDKDNIFVVTNIEQKDSMISATTGRILPNHILAEPAARNTAACIGYAAIEIIKKYGDGIMCIFPSDHFIKNEPEFRRVISAAIEVAETKDKLVTIGLTPTFPSTGYGYIKFNKDEKSEVRSVIEFKEKPDINTAKDYIKSGNYAWNSGMFVWKASIIIKNFERFLPVMFEDFMKIKEVMGSEKEREVIEKIYPNIQKISIDYGIMERASNVVVIPAEFGWNDIGTWDMMRVLHDEDKFGNILLGDTLAINTTNSIAYSSGKLIATIGVDNLIIVETPDAIMICSKDKAQDAKLVVDALSRSGRTDLL